MRTTLDWLVGWIGFLQIPVVISFAVVLVIGWWSSRRTGSYRE